MLTQHYTEQLMRFVNHHGLLSANKIIAFNAVIYYDRNNEPGTFDSEVHVINLPQEKAFYIIASQDGIGFDELYRTGTHQFQFQDDFTLLIAEPATALRVVVKPTGIIS